MSLPSAPFGYRDIIFLSYNYLEGRREVALRPVGLSVDQLYKSVKALEVLVGCPDVTVLRVMRIHCIVESR